MSEQNPPPAVDHPTSGEPDPTRPAAGGPGTGGQGVSGPGTSDRLGAGGPFSEYLGLEVLEVSGERYVARWPIGTHLHQPFGVVHGGAYAAVVETAGSIGANLALAGAGHAVGVSNSTDFFRSCADGVLDVVAEPLHQGHSQQVWRVDIRDEAGRLVAGGTLRLQNLRPRRD